MKVVICLFVVLAVTFAYPQRDGIIFQNEAIRQAQQQFLIPPDAQIQKVEPGIELAAYEQIPGDQRILLAELLGDSIPPEVLNKLQAQIDEVGRN